MFLQMMKSKLHRVTVTEANLNYMGSITIDRTLMDAAGLLPHEKVLIVNNNNGERFETYVIEGKADSGIICLNGAAARKAQLGDVVIVIAFAWMNEEEARTLIPRVVFVDEANRITSYGVESRQC